MGSRETVVFCLDISPGLGGEDLESTLDVARLAVRRKITAYPKDEVGLVLAGTAKSANPLYDDMGEQYAHINVVQDVLPVAAAGIKTLRFLGSPIPPEDRASDVDLYSALVTAVYVIINRIGKRRKAPGDTHRIMLTTAGTEPLSMPDEDALDQVASQCKDFNMCVPRSCAPMCPCVGCNRSHAAGASLTHSSHSCVRRSLRHTMRSNIVVLTIGIDVDAGTCSPDSASKRSTLEMLAALGGKMGDRLRCTALAAALAELSMHRPPAPKPSRSKFKGALELPDLKIRVVVYPKVVETRLPPPKSFSLIARERFPYPAPALPAADEAGAGSAGGSLDELPAHDTSAIVALGRNPWEVEKDRSYTAVSDRTRNVGPDKTIKAHKYGPDFVVEQQTEAGSFKWSTGDKCLKVVEFVRQDGLLPKDRMGGCDVLMADESDPHAGAAIGALVTALMDTETAMVVRFIPRKNAAPRASACWPHAEEVDGSIAYSLLLDNRPFAEEVRTAAWPPAEAASAPTAGQLAAASELIDAMMLNTSVGGSDEAAGAHIDLDELRNPYMEHMNRLIVERALTAGAEIPELDPAIAATVRTPAHRSTNTARGSEALHSATPFTESLRPARKSCARVPPRSSRRRARLPSGRAHSWMPSQPSCPPPPPQVQRAASSARGTSRCWMRVERARASRAAQNVHSSVAWSTTTCLVAPCSSLVACRPVGSGQITASSAEPSRCATFAPCSMTVRMTIRRRRSSRWALTCASSRPRRTKRRRSGRCCRASRSYALRAFRANGPAITTSCCARFVGRVARFTAIRCGRVCARAQRSLRSSVRPKARRATLRQMRRARSSRLREPPRLLPPLQWLCQLKLPTMKTSLSEQRMPLAPRVRWLPADCQS